MNWPSQGRSMKVDHRGDGGCDVHSSRNRVRPSVAADPSEVSLDNPSLGQDDESMQFIALDDLKSPAVILGDGRGDRSFLVAGISEDALDEAKEAARGT
jgi:hypothetical protein